jgi:hypothetical protein
MILYLRLPNKFLLYLLSLTGSVLELERVTHDDADWNKTPPQR